MRKNILIFGIVGVIVLLAVVFGGVYLISSPSDAPQVADNNTTINATEPPEYTNNSYVSYAQSDDGFNATLTNTGDETVYYTVENADVGERVNFSIDYSQTRQKNAQVDNVSYSKVYELPVNDSGTITSLPINAEITILNTTKTNSGSLQWDVVEKSSNMKESPEYTVNITIKENPPNGTGAVVYVYSEPYIVEMNQTLVIKNINESRTVSIFAFKDSNNDGVVQPRTEIIGYASEFSENANSGISTNVQDITSFSNSDWSVSVEITKQ